MKKLLFTIIFIFCISSIAHAEQEILNEFNEESLPVLNENTRELFDRVYDSEGDITTNTTAIASLDKFPAGGIIMWSGAIADIPTGWVLCDGTNSTPDLIDRFVVCAKEDDGGVAKTNVTGALTQSGDGTIPSHYHTMDDASFNIFTVGAGSGNTYTPVNNGGSPQVKSGTSGTGTTNIAIYYALAFIMKT